MNKRIAILHAKVPFFYDDAEFVVEHLTEQLKKRGFNVEVISMPFKCYPNNVLLDSYLMWRMVDVTESNGEKIDLVISMQAPTCLVKHPNKVIWLMNQYRAAYNLLNNTQAFRLNTTAEADKLIQEIHNMENLTIPEAKGIYAISSSVAEQLKQNNGLDSVPLYHPPALEGRYFFGGMGDYILSTTRPERNKRVDLLIRALPHCSRDIKAVIVGEGAETENLKKLAYRLGVSERVEFLGAVSDEELLKLYAESLGVCVSSAEDGYCYTALEAFLSKKPILACIDSVAALEFAKKDVNSFVVDVDAGQMGACIEKLFQNKKLAQEMGKNGYDAVKDINWDYVVDQLTKTIR